MLADDITDPSSVLNPNNYVLARQLGGPCADPLGYLRRDQPDGRAELRRPDRRQLHAPRADRPADAQAINLAAEYDSTFTATADLSSVIALQFGLSRSDRADRHGLLRRDDHQYQHARPAAAGGPASLAREPVPGEPEGNEGRAPDGSWIIDLSGDLPADGILGPGQSSAGQPSPSSPRPAFRSHSTRRSAAYSPATRPRSSSPTP